MGVQFPIFSDVGSDIAGVFAQFTIPGGISGRRPDEWEPIHPNSTAMI